MILTIALLLASNGNQPDTLLNRYALCIRAAAESRRSASVDLSYVVTAAEASCSAEREELMAASPKVAGAAESLHGIVTLAVAKTLQGPSNQPLKIGKSPE